eukprot:m.99026 g.99026  ORF g.99026 m.99026 type:complete len:57 (+) comp12528_c1_seq1:2838-3008(+)
MVNLRDHFGVANIIPPLSLRLFTASYLYVITSNKTSSNQRKIILISVSEHSNNNKQ